MGPLTSENIKIGKIDGASSALTLKDIVDFKSKPWIGRIVHSISLAMEGKGIVTSSSIQKLINTLPEQNFEVIRSHAENTLNTHIIKVMLNDANHDPDDLSRPIEEHREAPVEEEKLVKGEYSDNQHVETIISKLWEHRENYLQELGSAEAEKARDAEWKVGEEKANGPEGKTLERQLKEQNRENIAFVKELTSDPSRKYNMYLEHENVGKVVGGLKNITLADIAEYKLASAFDQNLMTANFLVQGKGYVTNATIEALLEKTPPKELNNLAEVLIDYHKEMSAELKEKRGRFDELVSEFVSGKSMSLPLDRENVDSQLSVNEFKAKIIQNLIFQIDIKTADYRNDERLISAFVKNWSVSIEDRPEIIEDFISYISQDSGLKSEIIDPVTGELKGEVPSHIAEKFVPYLHYASVESSNIPRVKEFMSLAGVNVEHVLKNVMPQPDLEVEDVKINQPKTESKDVPLTKEEIKAQQKA
jgi:hypothetical protein